MSAAMPGSHCSVSQVHQHGAGRVGDVGDVQPSGRAAGHVPDQPGVDRPDEQVAGSRPARGAPSTLSRIQRSSARRSRWPAAARPGPGTGRRRRRARRARGRCVSVRVSCQTIALPTGLPVVRSHTTVVSRWLVMPTAAMSAGCRLSPSQRGGGDRPGVLPDLGGVVFDPPGAREDLPVLPLVGWPPARPSWSNRMQRVDVVPWSIAATYRAFIDPCPQVVGVHADEWSGCTLTN